MKRCRQSWALILLSIIFAGNSRDCVVGTQYSVHSTSDPGSSGLRQIDQTDQQAIDRELLPGAVILVVHRGEMIFRKAYGSRSKEPAEAPMTVDTVFDLASLTKPIATATSLMILLERGKLRLSDRVVDHWPEFAPNGKDKITLEQLLTHTSGLIADNPLRD